MKTGFRLVIAAAALVLSVGSNAKAAQKEILNVSYDVARDVYRSYNPLFVKEWKTKTGENISIKQSHGGSSKQVRAVADGLEADVVTMNQPTDVNFLVSKGLVAKDWAKRFPDNASPYTSTMVFIVRKGNPKGIKDWSDLIKPGVVITIPHPKNTGNGRYTYLAAWGWALRQPGGNAKTAEAYVRQFFKHVPAFSPAGRDATTNFIQRGQGDVLISFESEAKLIAREFGHGQFDVVYPSQSLLAEFPVAVIDPVVKKHGTRQEAEAYLKYLWSPAGQENAARNYLRPRDPVVLKKYANRFPPIKTFTAEDVFGGWDKAFKTHFGNGGTFDQLTRIR